MTSTQVVKMSVRVITNSPSQDYTHPDDHNLPTYDMTPGFKPFTVELKLQIIMEKVIFLSYKKFHWITFLQTFLFELRHLM